MCVCFVLFCFVFLQPSISDLLEGEEQDASQDVDVQEITSGSEQVENYNHKHELLISVIIFITFLKPSSLYCCLFLDNSDLSCGT